MIIGAIAACLTTFSKSYKDKRHFWNFVINVSYELSWNFFMDGAWFND